MLSHFVNLLNENSGIRLSMRQNQKYPPPSYLSLIPYPSSLIPHFTLHLFASSDCLDPSTTMKTVQGVNLAMVATKIEDEQRM